MSTDMLDPSPYARTSVDELSFLSGGGEMGALMRAHDWSQSSLGPPERWPQALRLVVRIILNTGHPMYIWWGEERACLYNDAYRASIGPERHPVSLGRPAREVWDEIWDIIGPQIEQVMSGGGATWHVNQLVPITRNGVREDVYWTYSYSPIDDEDSPHGVGGVLVVCSETTQQVVAAHKLMTERDQLAQLFEQAPTFMALLQGPDHRFEIVNPGYLELIGHRAVVGLPVRDALPEAAAQGYVGLLDQVYATGKAYTASGARFAFQAEPGGPIRDRYIDFVYQPILDDDDNVTGIFVDGVDVTERTVAALALDERTSQLRLLDAIGEATRSATDARAIMDVTTRMLAEHLGAMRCAYADVERDEDRFTIRGDWTAPGFRPVLGTYALTMFGTRAVTGLRQGLPLIVHDVDAELSPDDGADTFNALEIKAIVCAGLVKEEGLRGLMSVHMAEPRHWTEMDVALIQEVAERSWAHIERVRANDTLAASEARYREMAAKLRDSNRMKDEFLATLAHELRNPLAPIRNSLELMKMAPDDGEIATSARAVMERQVGHIVRLIDDLLDLSRVSRGLVELRRARVPLAALVRDAVETSRPLIEQSNHTLTVKLPDEELLLEVDPTRIVQVFSNLLNNAAKFTPYRGHIDLEVVREGDAFVRVVVRDSGVGIPDGMLEEVFDMFTQVDRSHTHTGSGLGIGLTLVRRLVELHGGTVVAQSPGTGGGSEFIVRLPLARQRKRVRNAATATLAALEPVRRRRILVADDNIDGARTLAMMLEVLGHEVVTAHDGEQALTAAMEFRPDVMVLDIAMPGFDGHAVARCIREEPWGKTILMIAASGWGMPEHKRESRDAGFDHHLVKPVDLKALEALLE